MPLVAAASVLFLLLPYCVAGTSGYSSGLDISSELQWGTENCKTPDVANIIPSSRPYYKAGFRMRPKCTEGYEPSEHWIKCERRGSTSAWSAEVTCIQNCKAPDGANIVPSNRLYYKAGLRMTPKCSKGYTPSERWITCERRGSTNGWSAEVTCINLIGLRPTIATQVSKSSSEKDNLMDHTTTSKQLSGGMSEVGDTHVEHGPSFSIFSAIQLLQVGVLLFINAVFNFLSRTGKGGRETPLVA